MAAKEEVEVARVKLGTQGLEVSKLGFGCMGLSGVYNAPVSETDGISIIKDAFNKGITFFDTADVYGASTNEVLVGKALKQLPREKVQLATKFGIVGIGRFGPGIMEVKGTPEYVRSCCEASLNRLGVDYIDLYYQHRIDTSVPIEETMGELKKLVEEGKIRYIGLSEASADTIRRAHAIHPVTAVQMEWSLWTRDIEEEIVPICRELGIGIVPYSPLGRGFFGGKAVVETLPENSLLTSHPRFQGEFLDKNKIIHSRLENLCKKRGCTLVQLACHGFCIKGTMLYLYLVGVELIFSSQVEESKKEVQGVMAREERELEAPRVKLGSQGLEVSRLGFRCQGLTGLFDIPASEETGIAIIKDAFHKGVTFVDTADFYGGYC